MLSGVVAVGSGSYARTSLAVLADGTAYQWGARVYNNLQECDAVPRPVHDALMRPVTGIIDVAAGDVHNLLLKQDGTVWAWGTNGSGQMGDGTNEPSTSPVQVQGLSDIVGIAAGGWHSLALKRDGTVWAWGLGSEGQLGDGTQSLGRKHPVQVIGSDGVGVLTGITAIAAGREHSLALRDDGTVWAWGNDSFGQIGGADERILPNLTPTAVQSPAGGGMLTGITWIAGGNDHSLAVGPGGTVWGWGKNIHGELGNGSQESSRRPVQALNLRWAFMVTAGNRHSAALANAKITRSFTPLVLR
jgi:alpha-tubulin suppressor-like RCC1 family protein